MYNLMGLQMRGKECNKLYSGQRGRQTKRIFYSMILNQSGCLNGNPNQNYLNNKEMY